MSPLIGTSFFQHYAYAKLPASHADVFPSLETTLQRLMDGRLDGSLIALFSNGHMKRLMTVTSHRNECFSSFNESETAPWRRLLRAKQNILKERKKELYIYACVTQRCDRIDSTMHRIPLSDRGFKSHRSAALVRKACYL
jgi:hypothetical protein